MNASRAPAEVDHTGRAGGGLWAPGLANLALGILAMLPLYLAWWLWTKYLPMDCRSPEDVIKPGVTNCYYPTLDHAPVIMFLLTVTGVPMLVLVLIVDVLLPLRRQGRRLGTWLGMAALIPIPFAVCLSLT
ncbi:hypothetical protein GCM10023085_53910 [Actinomadura viridis]